MTTIRFLFIFKNNNKKYVTISFTDNNYIVIFASALITHCGHLKHIDLLKYYLEPMNGLTYTIELSNIIF